MPVIFRLEGHEVDLDDVPLETYAEIEKTTSIPWYRLSTAPMAYAAAGALLAKKCAAIVGEKLPEPLTPKVLVQLFEVTSEENLPSEYNDGIPDPKVVEDEPATT